MLEEKKITNQIFTLLYKGKEPLDTKFIFDR